MPIFKNKNVLLLGFILMVSCQKTEKEPIVLDGLWCENSYHHCNYFEGDKCILDRAEVRDYELVEDTIVATNSAKPKDKYLFNFEGDTLSIKNIEQKYQRKFYQPLPKNDGLFESFSCSYLGGFLGDYNIDISYDGTFFMELNFHDKIEEGYYSGQLDSISNNFLHQLIKAMSLDVPSELDPRIVSDIEEWAVIFKFKEKQDIRLYHNYLAINKNHKMFSGFMLYLPYLIKDNLFLRKGNIDFEVEKFRKREFERNLEMYRMQNK